MSRQKKTDPRLWWLLGAAAVASLLWLAVTFGLIGSAMNAQEREAVRQTVGDRLMLILLTWAAGMAAIGWGLKRWFDLWVTPSVQLAEEAQLDPEFSEKFLRFIIDEVIRHHEQAKTGS